MFNLLSSVCQLVKSIGTYMTVQLTDEPVNHKEMNTESFAASIHASEWHYSSPVCLA